MGFEIAAVKQYNKAESILGLRQRKYSEDQALARVARLPARLDSLSLPPYRREILSRACADLMGESATQGAFFFRLRDHVVEEIGRLSDAELPRYLFYRYRYDVLPAEKRLDDFPPCLQIEPTSICNYRCVFCYQTDSSFSSKGGGHMGMMSLDLFKKVVDEAEGNVEAITLASRGEPLIAREFKEMLAYLSGKFLALKINTNAWLLTEDMAHAILEAGPNTLVISADAAAEPLYSRLRVNGRLDRVLANVRRFKEIRERHYPKTGLITRVSGVRYSEDQNLDDMEGLWGELVDQVAFVDYNPWENAYVQPPNGIETACSDLWRRMFVWWDGRAAPCDVDYKSMLQVGDATKEGLSDIWRGEYYKTLRNRHRTGQRQSITPCKGCAVV